MTDVGRTLLTTDARALPYPPDLAPFLRGDGEQRGAAWAELLRRLFSERGRGRFDAGLLGALRERLARPGGLVHPATAELVRSLVPLRRCRRCGRRVLAARGDAAFCSDGCAAGRAPRGKEAAA